MAKYSLPYVIARVFTVSLTIYSECFLPGASFPCSTHTKTQKQTKQSFILTFLRVRYCMNYSIRRRPLTWTILIIGTIITPSFPPSCLYINSIDNLFSNMTTWWIVVTCTAHPLLKKACQDDLIERDERI